MVGLVKLGANLATHGRGRPGVLLSKVDNPAPNRSCIVVQIHSVESLFCLAMN